ncbi:PQQ-dependent sugar dehydrogenase [Stieleria sp. TO1_6]|uniref:PQQ-dependent sugar dehydrogenase n=1 Tax=Stieleria tagensis TaxID=2956795 RepID=UPI00209AC10B|nr:PQQ-dependent sugar dehydrogenase [Stieleria tagensis]MCO8122397.1 PQQ-dependent sugar dehydrogenase [Stieleria tagensis]
MEGASVLSPNRCLPKIWVGCVRWVVVGVLVTAITSSISGQPPQPATAKSHTAWTESRLKGSPEPPLPIRVQRVHPHLQLDSPVTVMDLPGCDRRLVLQRDGKLLTFVRNDDVQTAQLALDIGALAETTAGEKIAAARDATLDPDFKSNRHVYVVWGIRPLEISGGTRVSRFTLDRANPPTIDPQSRLDLITYPSGDHVGASLNFGPDGMLYVTTGDGARPFPPDAMKTAQDLSDLRGSVLRIDVAGAVKDQPYRIPTDNPFVDRPGARGEIYAFGLRNGFRAAFDPQTDAMWVADVGWERCELVHQIVKGGNHGWSLYEGPHPVDPNQTAGPGPRIEAAIVIPRSEAQSITGGVFVPNGVCWTDSVDQTRQMPAAGHYLYGCYMNGNVWSVDVHSDTPPAPRKIASTGLRIIDFFTSDHHGETQVFVVDMGGGIYRLVANDRATYDESFPRLLSRTGLFRDLDRLTPAPGVVRYQPTATMFRDGLQGDRIVAVPTDQPVDPAKNQYPVGTVFANTLSRQVVDLSGRKRQERIETQVLLFDGLNWNPYTYRWNESQSDAELVPASGARRELRLDDPRFGVRTIQHRFAARDQCSTCHHVFNQGGMSLTPENLSRSEQGTPPSPAHPDPLHQFRSWGALVESGYVTPARSPARQRLVDPTDPQYNLNERARSYLAMNCGHCHRPAGGASSGLHLRRSDSNEQMSALDVVPSQGDFGIGAAAKLIAPGHPELSVLLYRLATAGPGSMPRLGCQEPDLEGAKLLWDWIAAMEPSGEPPANATPTSDAMLAWRERLDLPPTQAAAQVSQLVNRTTDPVVAGLLQPWIAPSKRTHVVGDTPDIEQLLMQAGDAERGRQWFFQSAASQCRECHRHSGIGTATGPALDSPDIKRDKRALLQQLIFPSHTIAPQWRATTVVTTDGQILTGRVMDRESSALTLQLPDSRTVQIKDDQIEMQRPSETSLMPAGLLATMTPQEVADLLAFLMVPPKSTPQPKQQDFGRYQNCPVIENDSTRVVVCPQSGGRILEYSLNGKNALFVSAYDLGTADSGRSDDPGNRLQWKKDPSGGRFDIGPEMVTGKRPELFLGKWTAQRMSPLSVRLTSPDAAIGVRLVRDFTLDANSSRLTCKQSILNLSDGTLTCCHWSRTLANGAGICLIPLQGFQRFPRHYVRYEQGALQLKPDDPAVEVRDGFLQITGPPLSPKLGMETMAGWVAHQQRSDLMFIKQFPTFPDRPYLEVAGLTLATWTPETGETIEIEPIGPGETLAPGQSASFTEVWHLLPNPYPQPGQQIDLKRLQQQVRDLPATPWSGS